MKKEISALICLAMVMGMSACGVEATAKKSAPKVTASSTETGNAKQKKNLSTDELYTFSCRQRGADGKEVEDSGGNAKLVEFTSYKQGWDDDKTTYDCMADEWLGDPPTDVLNSIKSIRTADDDDEESYGKDGDYGVRRIYAECASTTMYPIDGRTDSTTDANRNPFETEGDPKEAYKMLKLCPDHPMADKIKQNADQVIAERQQRDDELEKQKNGELVTEGTYAIGSQMKPGTWKTKYEVSDCYWELRDANGTTIDNDFVVGAPSVTVQVPDTATSFTSKGCGTWIKQ